MITFGFKSKTGGLLRAVVAIVLGVIMVSFPGSSLVVIVKILAAFLIASGLVSLVFGIVNRQNGGLALMITNTLVDIILGILIFMFPAEVASIVMFLLGLLIMFFGIFQIVVLMSANRVLPVGIWTFLLPVLCAAGGAMVMFHPFGLGSVITLVAGIALLVYGVSELMATWKMRKAMKEYEIHYSAGGRTDRGQDSGDRIEVKDVDYEKVGDDK
ncbi:MAG: DUF308 domain-containing protein [Bacteroidetes bacterium]|uniref:DUF308 domain-containing protein n=1 Tax=Candidatus Cryptobacteroides faecavium TaxID=2840762 RepID=A0A9D9IFB8_9BACT|nr:DUF308 domain-containing protein [Candidatus Cryptobacteroides faecavium]